MADVGNSFANELAKQQMRGDVVDELRYRTWPARFLVWLVAHVLEVPKIEPLAALDDM